MLRRLPSFITVTHDMDCTQNTLSSLRPKGNTSELTTQKEGVLWTSMDNITENVINNSTYVNVITESIINNVTENMTFRNNIKDVLSEWTPLNSTNNGIINNTLNGQISHNHVITDNKNATMKDNLEIRTESTVINFKTTYTNSDNFIYSHNVHTENVTFSSTVKPIGIDKHMKLAIPLRSILIFCIGLLILLCIVLITGLYMFWRNKRHKVEHNDVNTGKNKFTFFFFFFIIMLTHIISFLFTEYRPPADIELTFFKSYSR
jgi:hypothetical protein